MSSKWLNLFFRFSGYTFNLKQKIIQADSWAKAMPYAVILIAAEFGFVIISLPMYLLVPPEKVQEEGRVFPRSTKVRPQVNTYIVRRKISLATFGGAGGAFLIKILLVGIVSFYLLGIQQLMADTQDWTFDTPADYIYDSAKVEVTGGVAQLKDLGGTVSGTNTNTGFNTDASGWTYADWLQPGNTTVGGAYNAASGNPGGHVRITMNSTRRGRTVAGYYQQSFTTTQNSPDSATVSLDWSSITYTSPSAPTSYKVYAFIESASGIPSGTSTAVWASPEITGTTAWAGSGSIDIRSKVPTAGTYYVKFAAYAVIPGTGTATFSYVSGFDNVAVNWSKTTHSYASDKPTTTPVVSLTMPKTVSWNSFTETATKNGGEIYYQMSADNGTTWQYYNGSAWATATLSTDYNTATDVNSNISKFTTSTNQIKWRAYLSSSGSQQVILDNISIGYTQNQRPAVQSLAPAQNTTYGYVHVNYNLQDTENDPSSLTAYEYSLNGTFSDAVTMTASTTDPAHNGVTGLTASLGGTPHTFVWDAKSQLGNVYNAGVYVRLRPNDGIGNGNYTTSSVFTVDYVSSTVSNVTAVQNSGTTTVAITYDLFDNTTDNITVEMQVSGDGGSTWTVPATSVTGDIGSTVTSGNGKTITWNAKADYPNQQKSNLRVQIRAKDKFQNQGTYTSSANFSLDTLPPATNVTASLLAQPNAGDTTVLIGGSFTEANPNTNDFAVAIDGGDYGLATAGDSDTAAPSNKNTNVGATLDGNDYISKVKITHTDDYGQAFANENSSPSSTVKYVKPYTPQAPILNNPVTTRLDLQINPHASEASDLEYAIYETSTSKYIQSDGTLGDSPVWQVMGTGSGQWGNGLGVSGKVRITGLSSPVALYGFRVKSRNPSDNSHAVSSESAWSAVSSIPNTAPAIVLDSYAQTTDGTQYVNVNYTGTDGQGDISSLVTYEYSTDNSTWQAMTEKSGVGSNGISNLVFLPTGSAYKFAWNSGADLPNTEDSTVYVRLRGNDTLASGALATSPAFEIDNKLPVTANLTASQTAGAKTVAISYDLTDSNNSTVQIDISSDGGSTWTVATSSLTGAVGANVTPGSGKTAAWNAGVDFNGQYNTQMKVRVRARDAFGNQSSDLSSANFTLDTKAPVLTNVTASQDAGAKTFTFHYDLAEDSGNSTVALAISSDGGSTWIVPVTSASGNLGAGIGAGTGKTVTWNAATDYNDQEKTAMQIRLTAADSFTNSANYNSANFSLDSKAPRLTNVTAIQTLGSTNVVFQYDLADQNNSEIALDISSNGGGSWVVADTSVTGAVGAGQTTGTGKTITWAAATDFPNQDLSTMRVRLRGTDTYSNASDNVSSANFSLDTLPPATSVTTDLKAQPLAGASSVLIGGSFTENNPNTNDFYVAIDGGSYGSATAGSANTASPADQLTAIGATLDGNDYISMVKITHADDYGQAFTNENFSPNSSYKYVKPYTPSAPTVDNPAVGEVDVLINKNPAETNGLEYAIYEVTQGKYVQSNGTLGASPAWQGIGTLFGQWGFYLGVSGKVRVIGLTNPSYTYQFQVKSRNTSDSGHAASSESVLSGSASSVNQSPVITINSVAQTTDGSKYVTIDYTGSDLESENSSLIKYQYSTNGSTWSTMTEKGGVGSDGTTGLAFAQPGSAHQFMWDVGTDLNNTEDSTVYVRLQANDGTSDGAIAASSAFTVDTKTPTVSVVSGVQTVGSNNVNISYNLSDLSNSTVEVGISGDGGSTWTVPVTTAGGDFGAGITPGDGKTITWNPGVDYSGQEDNDVRSQIRATDAFGNQSSFVSSANFSIDTKSPVFANVAAVQNAGNNTVAITYDLSDAHNATVELDISSDGGSTWTVTDTSVTGDIGAGQTPGNGKTITWDAGTDFSGQEIADMRVRLRATDIYNNATGDVSSGDFALDTKAPTITSVTAAQASNSDNINIGYNLFDSGNATIAIDISSDGGSTWTVTDTSVTGDIGSVAPGLLKAIVWNAGADYSNQENNNMKVRIRGTDGFNNTSVNIELFGLFSLDTKAPAIASTADLQAQPRAGDAVVSVGGSFTETNPGSNSFSAAVSGGAYAATTTGQANTATPSNQDTAVGVILTGGDYISKVKLVHVDDYGHTTNNENTSPNSAYKYVKPYTPLAPTVNNPQNNSVDLTINPNSSEASSVEYAVYEVSTGKYLQANGSLGASPVWKTLGTGVGQWGNLSGTAGKVTVTGLTSPVASYSFMVKSRNPNDAAHAASSESDYSAVAGIANTAPSISITGASQQLVGGYVLINYLGTDGQNDTNNLNSFEYSTNGLSWQAMTEKSGVGSDGTTNLVFGTAGTAYVFAWDAATDLPNQENMTVYVRLRSTDGLANSNLAVSSAFSTDTQGPIVSGISIAQTAGSSVVTFNYDLSDAAGADNSITLEISDDSGATYAVPITTLSGDVGAGVTAGTNRSVTWQAGTDFPNQESNVMKIRIRGTDRYGNTGSYAISGDFSVDTKTPVVSGVSAAQTAGSSNVTVNYTLTDNTPAGHLVEFLVSDDGGATWNVATSTRSGDIGLGQTTGAKSFVWSAGTDFTGQDVSNMRVRVRAKDYYGNQGAYSSSINFSLDTKAPIISNISASQTAGTNSVTMNYDLGESATTVLDISRDGGATWTVAKTTLTGDLGAVTAGNNKSVTWNAGTDFGNEEDSTMRIRLRGTDSFGNASSYYESTDFAVDTAAPLNLTSLTKFSSTDTSVTLTWPAVTDANFDHYELWHGASQTDVSSRAGTASKWSTAQDANLNNPLTISTVITGLTLTNDYYVKIWAVDSFGNEISPAIINVYEAATPTPTPEPVVTTAGGAVAPVVLDKTAPGKPILNPIASPTRNTSVSISGLAEPRAKVDLYDNGNLVARLNSLASSNGLFSQNFTLAAGRHSLTAKAIDDAGNSSDFSESVIIEIVTGALTAPIVLTPQNNSSIADATPQIVGVAEPNNEVAITLDGQQFTVTADINGAWNFIVPSTLALTDGRHALSVVSRDLAGNQSASTDLSFNKIPAVAVPSAPAGTAISLPSEALISETTGATELPGIPVPKVTAAGAGVTVVGGDTLSFSGTSLPNSDVVVYLHSDQALVYRTRTDQAGNWQINHSQNVSELAPGDHTIYAVALDTGAKVKSRPSAVSSFTVKRNFWVMVYDLMNWQTTAVTLAVLLLTIFWLYRIRKASAAKIKKA